MKKRVEKGSGKNPIVHLLKSKVAILISLINVRVAAGDCQIFYYLNGTCVTGRYNQSQLPFLGNNSGLIEVGVHADIFVKDTTWRVFLGKRYLLLILGM